MTRPTALVTGASRGIGRAIARRLAAQYDVVAAARSGAELDALAAEIARAGGRCIPLVLDVTDGPAVARALAGVRADVVVNNAGVGILKPLLETSPEEWHRQVDVNFNALYHVTRALLPGMVERKRGHVVIVGSIAGRSAFAGGAAYTGTKHAVMAFAECLLLEVRDHGVKVSVVSPGSVATGFGGGDATGKGWALTPEDVAEAVAGVLATPPNVLVHRLEVRALSKQG
ncbi:MAG: SDR family oxidoreductase [Gemmatimonadota bacterium]|nr:SDR family oxidoreductase [Gemmatimonadota bacterium]MDE3217175.1 SDR family oxidoreductase [Gemmatimonadota bacterium]